MGLGISYLREAVGDRPEKKRGHYTHLPPQVIDADPVALPKVAESPRYVYEYHASYARDYSLRKWHEKWAKHQGYIDPKFTQPNEEANKRAAISAGLPESSFNGERHYWSGTKPTQATNFLVALIATTLKGN